MPLPSPNYTTFIRVIRVHSCIGVVSNLKLDDIAVLHDVLFAFGP